VAVVACHLSLQPIDVPTVVCAPPAHSCVYRTVIGAGLFTVTSGACTVASDATCFRSPNYPSNYDNNHLCTITVTAHEEVTLSVTAFDVEADSNCFWDSLTVNGMKYCGTSGPEGVRVAAGSTMYFASDEASDNSVVRSGFEICGAHPTSVPGYTCCVSVNATGVSGARAGGGWARASPGDSADRGGGCFYVQLCG
jgi:hypothetical protein